MERAVGLLGQILTELRQGNLLLTELVRTSRFNRGGYDGPFLSARTVTLDGTEPVEIFPGRGEPAALLIETDGTGAVGDLLFISDDRQQIAAGYRLLLETAGSLRIIADRHQHLYALPVFVAGAGAVAVRMRVGRL